MKDLALNLIGHPILFTMTLFCGIILVGLTYEFLLRLFTGRGFEGGGAEPNKCLGTDEGHEPPEPSVVPAKPVDPDGILEGAEELPTEDDTINDCGAETEYIYSTDDWNYPWDSGEGHVNTEDFEIDELKNCTTH